MNKIARFSRPIKKMYKLLKSYFKSNWSLADYPIEYRQQEMIDLSNSNLIMYPWEARIINWYWMNGDGQTKEEAYRRLEERFEQYKLDRKDMPRPGTKVQVIFASVDVVDEFEIEAVDFFRRVFSMDYYGIFISDESSLYDFCWSEESLNEKFIMIKEIYGIDAKNIEGYKIAGILQHIKVGTGIT